MELVKLHIDGKRVIADNRMTILEVAREFDLLTTEAEAILGLDF